MPPPLKPRPRSVADEHPTFERLQVSSAVPPLSRTPGAKPLPAPVKPAIHSVTNSSDAPLLRLERVVVDRCRPLDVSIEHTDRILVLGTSLAPKHAVVDILLSKAQLPSTLLAEIAGNISSSSVHAANVSLISGHKTGTGVSLRQHAGSLVGGSGLPSDAELRELFELLGIDEWFSKAEKLYPDVSLDCDLDGLPAAFPAEATLLRVWAPILLQHQQASYKKHNFYMIGPEAFAGMREDQIASTLGKLKDNTGWFRRATTNAGEVLEDGVEHSARCGRGSRRLDEKIWLFWRDRLIVEPEKRLED